MEITDINIQPTPSEPERLAKLNFRYGDMLCRFWSIRRGAHGPVVSAPVFYGEEMDEVIPINSFLVDEAEQRINAAILAKYAELVACPV